MDACLTPLAAWYLSLEFWWGVAQVAIALGFVIFVHELGHFAVAKLCGVQCDKFFVGFDIGGYKLSKKWGETEYGIGILPLGGYVKMLGQEDDPSRLAEQMAESQAAAEGIDESRTKEITGPDGKKYRVDRRSYMAKSVPQRMAIISAGVIMNIIFAFIFALVAYGIGVRYMPCVVGHTRPGSPAWMAGIDTGDEIVQIGDRTAPAFEHLTSNVMLGDLDEGVRFVIRKAATGEEVAMTLKPETVVGGVRIGIASAHTNRLIEDVPDALNGTPAVPGTPAEKAGFKPDDEVVAINGEPVSSQRDIQQALVTNVDEPLEFTVRRSQGDARSEAAAEEATLVVEPRALKSLGIVPAMGPIVAIQPNSPAARSGLKAGDVIVSINGRPVATAAPDAWDPATLPQVLRNETDAVTLEVRRESAERPVQVELAPREVDWLEYPESPGAPMSLPTLGVAYQIPNRIAAVRSDSPAQEEGLRPGDTITQARILWPEDVERDDAEIEFTKEKQNWPYFVEEVHHLPSDARVALAVERGGQKLTVELSPEAIDGVFVPERGLVFAPLMRDRVVNSLSEAATLAWDRTLFALTTVYRVLGKLGSEQVPMTSLGGPVKIAEYAFKSAQTGIVPLLLFLTMLSANLAVLNFLPIPVLDGGHMVFLAWEGVTGRPAGEKIVVALHTVGFIFILGLMIFVIGNDIRGLF